MGYVELRCHSAFSFGDGACTPEALVERAAAYGYPALGLTDTADLGGIIRFALAAVSAGIRPVIGAELVVDGYPAAFLAMTEEGYQNLAGLVTRARVGARGRPRLTWSELAERSAGLFALTGPASGEIASLIRARRPEEAVYQLGRWRDVFGERLAVEVQFHHVSGSEASLARSLIELAEWSRVPWVVTNEPRYLDQRSRLVHDLLTALRVGREVGAAAAAGQLLPNGEWRLKTQAE